MNSRTSDPATSKRAGAKASVFAGCHKERILAAFKRGGSATAYELHQITGLTVEQVCRRLPEMNNIEVVKKGGVDLERAGFRVWRIRK